jgi:serine protease inhibitor
MDRKQTIAKTFLGLLCPVLLLSAGCNELPLDMFDKKRGEPEIGPIDNSVVTANAKFGFNLFNEIRKTEQDKNIFISPFSVSIANEEGTEAAAVTSVGVRATSAPPAFIVDQPFFFTIRDNDTKTVLFMGIVLDP